jgi:hypothetical protein
MMTAIFPLHSVHNLLLQLSSAFPHMKTEKDGSIFSKKIYIYIPNSSATIQNTFCLLYNVGCIAIFGIYIFLDSFFHCLSTYTHIFFSTIFKTVLFDTFPSVSIFAVTDHHFTISLQLR